MFVIFFIISYAPEDSNAHYLMDKQLAHYFPAWEIRFDSTSGGLRTSQGCLDLLNWYINLETKFEVYLSRIFGLRYRNHYLGDYANHITDHRFEPFFQLKDDMRLLFTIAPHYYKGEDEIGIGMFFGRNYLNFLETFIIVEDFDRNFSLMNTPGGPDKIIYKQHPIKLKSYFNKYWQTGHLTLQFEVTNRYNLQSTEDLDSYPRAYTERGLHRFFYTRFWQDINKLRLGGIFDLKQSEFFKMDTSRTTEEDIFEIVIEPMIAYKLNEKWVPTLYLTYNYKTEQDTSYYQRDIYAYYLDVEFHPGGRFVWHFGTQRQFYYNNQEKNFKERRFTLGLEYRYKNVWFYFVEAMEGDFPTPKWLHNHTYVQLLIRF